MPVTATSEQDQSADAEHPAPQAANPGSAAASSVPAALPT